MPASTWLPEARRSGSGPSDGLSAPAEVPLDPALDPGSAGWVVPQLAEASPRTAALLPQAVTGTVGDTSPALASTWLPEAIGPEGPAPVPAGLAGGSAWSSRLARGRDRVAVASALGVVSAVALAWARRVGEAWARRVAEASAEAVVLGRLRRVRSETSASALRATRTSARTSAEVGRLSRAEASAETSWAPAAPAPRASRPPPSAAAPIARFIHKFT